MSTAPTPKTQSDAPKAKRRTTITILDTTWRRAKRIFFGVILYALVATVARALGFPFPDLGTVMAFGAMVLVAALLFFWWTIKTHGYGYIIPEDELYGPVSPSEPLEDAPWALTPTTAFEAASVAPVPSQGHSRPTQLVPLFQAPVNDPAED
jgi:hypothetical protein